MIKRILYILSLLLITTFLFNSCNFTRNIFDGGQVRKFEKSSFNPNRKMSTEDQLTANKNERKNKKQEQQIVEESGGIMIIPGVNRAENKGVREGEKK